MDPFQIGYPGALLAGFLSFASPCVLPLVPAYLSFLSGASVEQLTKDDQYDSALQRRVFLAALAFVVGFGTVFVIFGATATALSQALVEHLFFHGGIASSVAG